MQVAAVAAAQQIDRSPIMRIKQVAKERASERGEPCVDRNAPERLVEGRVGTTYSASPENRGNIKVPGLPGQAPSLNSCG